MKSRGSQVLPVSDASPMPAALASVVLTISVVLTPIPAHGNPDGYDSVAEISSTDDKPQLMPKGLIIFKRHILADEDAPVVEYSTIRFLAAAVDLVLREGGFVSIPKGQIVHHVVYPPRDADLQTEAHAEKLKETLLQYRQLAEQFRKSEPNLRPWIDRFEYELTMWRTGNCRVEGKWLDRYERQTARLRADFEQKRARILGIPYRPPIESDDGAGNLPPLWAVDFEQQLKEEREAFRQAYRKSLENQSRQRSQTFFESVEEERPFRTGWRLKDPPPPPPPPNR